MDTIARRLGIWSAVAAAVLVLLIDFGMIISTLLFPMTTITSLEAYVGSFSSSQMLPFIPSLILAPTFIVLMLCIHHYSSPDKRILSQLGFTFAVICAVILCIHYYIQLTVVQQGLLNNETAGLWLLVTPNPHSLFWTLAALGYGFMGISVLFVAPVFSQKRLQYLLVANGLIGLVFLIGNTMGLFIANIFASFAWGILFPVAALLIAREFTKA